jgi:SAM-dependent methyltransferase
LKISSIDRIAKRYLPLWVRLPIRHARLEAALLWRGVLDALQRGKYGGVPLPPAGLRYRVLYRVLDPARFLDTGLNAVQDVRSALGRHGRALQDFEHVLDFGCGCGRVLRWLGAMEGSIVGTDVHGKTIRWCRQSIPFASFEKNAATPPLPFEQGAFDLILCLSVIDHMDPSGQEAWLKELKRVARPGAFLLVTFLGRIASATLAQPEKEELAARGFYLKRSSSGSFAFQKKANALALCSRHLKVAEYIEGGINNTEDLAILRKAEG